MTMTASEVVAAVRRHYGADRDGLGPEWAALSEFSLATGAWERRADLFLVRAWRSKPKGHERIAVEVKVSRSDLLSELKRPEKAAPYEEVAHRFYLAVPKGLLRESDQIPEHWGILEISPKGVCRKKREAARNDSPAPLPEAAVVEAFRRAARAEVRIASAAEDDAAARVASLEKSLAASQRAEHNAKASATRNARAFKELVDRIGVASGWLCVCGKRMQRPSSNRVAPTAHADGTTQCDAGDWNHPEWDLHGLVEHLGITEQPDSTSPHHTTPMVALARRIAVAAHKGQVDKAGAPYIRHPGRVARNFSDETAKAVAWLHDVVEDTDVTLDDLRAAGLSDYVVNAVDAVTHRPNEPREVYYARVAADRYARMVKLADIADNSDPERLARLDPATRARLEAKYASARAALGDVEAAG